MPVLTPASPADLPPLGALVADDPSWRYPAGGLGREGVAHLRVWLTAGPEPGHLAVVTETGLAASVAESAGYIWAVLARRYPRSRLRSALVMDLLGVWALLPRPGIRPAG